MTLKEHIQRYLDFQNRADEIFASVRSEYPDLVRCAPGCDECCSVYFDLSLIEAFFIRGMLTQQIQGDQRDTVLQKAQDLASAFELAKETISKTMQAGKASPDAIENEAAKLKIECPLRDKGSCVLYDYRPMTCRLYGIPQRLGDRVVCCPKTGFNSGEKYSTVDIDGVNRQLRYFSEKLLRELLGELPVSVSTVRISMSKALLTCFDKDFFIALRDEYSVKEDKEA